MEQSVESIGLIGYQGVITRRMWKEWEVLDPTVRHPADGLGRFPGTRQSRPGKAGYPTRTTDSSRTEVGSTREPPDTTREQPKTTLTR